ncbi:MAG: hypothetical protein HFF17_05195 [Oscillospiraceae bacterium]|nr:hypothetical protein [Oscillospiraceae bacterium]
MRDEFQPRQLCALAVTALTAPLALVCAGVSWPWVLLGLALAGAFFLYYICAGRKIASRVGYAQMVSAAWGPGGPWVLGAYWLWIVLGCGMAAAETVRAFPADRAFPLIPLVVLLLAALTAEKGAAVVCRFGATLFFAVAALLAGALAFGGGDIHWENLRPAGTPGEAAGVLAVLLVPAAGWFLRDRMQPERAAWSRWFAAAAALGTAVSVVTVGALGLALARRSENAFWLMSRSISIFGVMERFEAVISALLAISACCLLALLLSAGRAALCALRPRWEERTAVRVTAAVAAACIWGAGVLPGWAWTAGSLLFWGILPVVTLGIVGEKKLK